MTSIFVAKLDFNATEDQLKSLFEEHGRVNRVTIAKDRETGNPRGFAFVEMANEEEADAAIKALDNFAINGRQIAVKKADDRGNTGKPSGDFRKNNSGDRPFRSNDNNQRDNKGGNSDYKSDYKKTESSAPVRPSFSPEDVIPQKVDRTKKEKDNRGSKDAPKKTKMEAYKKSGKGNRFFDDEDDDLDDLSYNRNNSGWDDDEDEDDED